MRIRRIVASMAAAVMVLGGVSLAAAPAQAATDYIISDAASCQAFLDGINPTGDATFGTCYVYGGTLPSGDTLTVSGTYILRPQSGTFRNEGTVNINGGDGGAGGLYVVGTFDNAGVLNINFLSQNRGQITNGGVINVAVSVKLYIQANTTLTNSGTINVNGTVVNSGVLTNECGGVVNGRDNITTNSVIEGACPDQTVTFDANGGTGSMSGQVSNVPAALTANAFANTGYSFASWNTASDGSGTSYANSATYPFDASDTLYVQWTATPAVDAPPIPPWVQAYGIFHRDDACLTSWTNSWQKWAEPITGGWVCTRTIPSLG